MIYGARHKIGAEGDKRSQIRNPAYLFHAHIELLIALRPGRATQVVTSIVHIAALGEIELPCHLSFAKAE